MRSGTIHSMVTCSSFLLPASCCRVEVHHPRGDHVGERSFPFKRQPGVNQRQIRTFAELEFVPKAENIVFIGPTGVGKTTKSESARRSGLTVRTTSHEQTWVSSRER